MTLEEFLYEQGYEVQGHCVIAEYDEESEERKIICYNGVPWEKYEDDLSQREVKYVYPEIMNGEPCIIIEVE